MQVIFLFVLHHIGDVWAQPSWLIEKKKKHAFAVYEHVMIYAGVISAGLFVLGMFEPWKFFFILIGHFAIDLYKYQYAKNKDKYWLIYPDQLLHYLQIVIVWLI